jgi:HSP20 family molecular chaperone IbpA
VVNLLTTCWGIPPQHNEYKPTLKSKQGQINMTYEIDLPGFTAEQITLTTQNNLLSLKAESPKRRYRETFTLPRHLDPATLQASLENGVLSLQIEERQECKPKQIPVHSAATQNLPALR